MSNLNYLELSQQEMEVLDRILRGIHDRDDHNTKNAILDRLQDLLDRNEVPSFEVIKGRPNKIYDL